MTYQDDDVINLRNEESSEEPEFRVESVDSDSNSQTPEELEAIAVQSSDKVKVKFDKFVSLVATHAYEEIFEKHRDRDIIISSDLLADLANAHEEKEDRKMPLIFVFGIVLGIILTWIILKY